MSTVPNPAAASAGGSEAGGATAAKPLTDKSETMTIDEVENGLACCTLCPPRIRCLCCGREDKTDLKKAAKGFFGARRRKCTDLFWLLLFVLFWVGMVVIGAIALSQGDARKILYGSDYKGQTCGVTAAVADRRLTAYPRLVEDIISNAGKTVGNYDFYGVCVAACPKAREAICNYDVPAVGGGSLNMTEVRDCLLNRQSPACAQTGAENPSLIHSNCWLVPTNSSSTLFRCIPVQDTTSSVSNEVCSFPTTVTSAADPACLVKTVTTTGVLEVPTRQSQVLEQLGTVQSIWQQYFGDLSRAFVPIMICSVFVVLVMGLAYLIFLQYCSGLMVMATILLTLLGLAAVAAFAYFKAGLLQVPSSTSSTAAALGLSLGTATSDSSRTAYSVLAYLFTALAVAALVLVIVLRNSIAATIATISLASVGLRQNMILLVMPIISTFVVLALLAWWAFSAAALMSITSPVTVPGFSVTNVTSSLGIAANASSFVSLEADTTMMYLQVYNLFGLLWTSQFIIYVSFLSISGTIASWYFGRNSDKCKEDDVPVFAAEDEPGACFGLCDSIVCCVPLCRSRCCLACWRTWRFHMGSAAFASFIVAIISMIRLVVAYVQKKLDQSKASSNRVLRAVMCYIQYCLSIVDCCMRIISRTTFVFVAIKGYSFISGSGKALAFIIGNVGTFGMLNVLSTVLFFLGKILMAGVAAGACWAFLESDYGLQTYEVTSTWLPAGVTFVFGYVVAAVFLDLYDACIDTVLITYVMDKAENGKHYHTKDPKKKKADGEEEEDDEDDIGAGVDHARGVQDGSKKPKESSRPGICCCCCRLCGFVETHDSVEPTAESGRGGGSAAASASAAGSS